MKYLYHCLIVSFLFLTGGLSAQQYRLRADLGTSGTFNKAQITAPVASLGLEALISLSSRTFLVPELGLQHTHITHKELQAPTTFIPGQAPISFFNFEFYKIRRTSAFVGVGLERHLHRVRLQVFGRVMKRMADRVTFSQRTNFQDDNRPDNVFTVKVKPEEVFSRYSQTGTLRYSQELTFVTGLSARFDLSEGIELGMSYLHALGNSALERRIISYCENCEVNPDADPVRSVASEVSTVSISSRFTF
jgi:hypothetical protein